jgi:hypothetical protein
MRIITQSHTIITLLGTSDQEHILAATEEEDLEHPAARIMVDCSKTPHKPGEAGGAPSWSLIQQCLLCKTFQNQGEIKTFPHKQNPRALISIPVL